MSWLKTAANSLQSVVNPQSYGTSSGGGSNWFGGLADGLAGTAKWLGSDAGKNTIGLLGTGSDIYFGNKAMKAQEEAAAQAARQAAFNNNLANQYLAMAKEDRDYQRAQQEDAQNALYSGWMTADKKKKEPSVLGLAETSVMA